MDEKVEDWLIIWFAKNSLLNKREITKKLSEDYFAKGWVDSFQFIKLIANIEENFKVRFSNDEFQNRAFSTLKGLSQIITAKLKK